MAPGVTGVPLTVQALPRVCTPKPLMTVMALAVFRLAELTRAQPAVAIAVPASVAVLVTSRAGLMACIAMGLRPLVGAVSIGARGARTCMATIAVALPLTLVAEMV